MKPKIFNKKLSLNKETIASLDRNEMNHVNGGENPTDPAHPKTYTCTCNIICPPPE